MPIKDNLQIILITYNRELHVRNTFNQLFTESSPIKDYDILVLDNNSSDGTANYVKEFIQTQPNVRYQKNHRNLGGLGNIVKAFEIAEKDYVWIICDDDMYDWSNWAQVETAINQEEDLIIVARYGLSDENKYKIENQIHQLSFVPAGIYKTSNINDAVMRNIVDSTYTLFPHLCLAMSLINQGKSFYVVNKAIVDNGMNPAITDCSYTRGLDSEELYQRIKTNTWIVGYANICSIIKDNDLRHRTFNVGMNFTHSNFEDFCNDMCQRYDDEENWMQILDVYLQLDKNQQKVLLELFLTRLSKKERSSAYVKQLLKDAKWAFDTCPYCGCQVDLPLSNLFRPDVYRQVLVDIADKYFEQFVVANKKIALWGAKQRSQIMVMSSLNLRKCLVKVVDSSYQSFKDKMFGIFDIEAPETLKHIDFDYLLIGSIQYKDEISNIARNKLKLNAKIINL